MFLIIGSSKTLEADTLCQLIATNGLQEADANPCLKQTLLIARDTSI